MQRVIQRFGGTRPGTWLFRTLLLPVDRRLVRASGGRFSIPRTLLGLPVVALTTTGARTGRLRTVPVVAIRFGDALALLGTNFGQPRAPAWTANLAAHPQAWVSWRGARWPLAAHRASSADAEHVWALATVLYPGFAAYRRRVTQRGIDVWILEPAA